MQRADTKVKRSFELIVGTEPTASGPNFTYWESSETTWFFQYWDPKSKTNSWSINLPIEPIHRQTKGWP